ncbi:hypothetical protein TSUD_95380 [Trifolium subterraneum]|uniref:Magnesium transporter n=1 Tax=Trifolium subterraneum TaxID=3900 RepID=A0A2Z6MCR2_TRISU|nr:hypothetical protein TSUD_95380 [Trifolium subterraneum]
MVVVLMLVGTIVLSALTHKEFTSDSKLDRTGQDTICYVGWYVSSLWLEEVRRLRVCKIT